MTDLGFVQWTRWPRLLETHGERLGPMAWAELFSALSAPTRPFAGQDHPGWAPVTFRDEKRCRPAVEDVHGLALDIDGTVTLEWAEETLGCWAGLIHTSKSHTADKHRFRVILPMRRSVTAEEHGGIWRRLDALWPGVFDPAAKDASRFWYWPSSGPAFETRVLYGSVFDPDAILSWPDPAEKRQAVPTRAAAPETAGPSDGRPGDAFARVVNWSSILEPHGWTCIGEHGGSMRWCRPGKRNSTSATTGGDGDWLYVFTSNAPPLDAQRSYDKLGAYAALNHGGDMREAVKALAAAGYGEQRKPRDHGVLSGELPPEAFEQEEPEESPPQRMAEEPARVRLGARSLREMMRYIADRSNCKEQVSRVSTCSGQLDRLMRGFRRRMVTVLGAETSWGKSSWAIMVVDEALRDGKRALIVTFEDSVETFSARFTARRCRLNATQVDDNVLTESERVLIGAESDRAPECPILLPAVGRDIEWVASAIQQLVPADGLDLVVLDYLQAATVSRRQQDRRNEVTYVARCFSDAVKAANCAGLLISQLKRLPPGQKPTMHDLKESGDIENGAEHVLLGYMRDGTDSRDGRVEQKRYVILEKNKDGPRSREDIFLPYDHGTASFLRSKAS
jgi:KaiC/GvpD/RAD55 family RecA-like ATPase